jgi:hypothetical protein
MKYPIPSRVPLPTPRPDQPAWAGPQAFPPRPMAPQMPMQGGNRFMDFLRNNSEALGAMSAGLLSGRTGPEQFGLGMQGFSQVRGAAKEKAEAKKKQNATIEWLRQNAPEYADAVDQGVLSAGDAYKMKLQAQTPKQYEPMSPVGKINSDFKNGIIDQATRDALILKAGQSEGMEMVSDGQGGFTFRQGAGVGQGGQSSYDTKNVANRVTDQQGLAASGASLKQTVQILRKANKNTGYSGVGGGVIGGALDAAEQFGIDTPGDPGSRAIMRSGGLDVALQQVQKTKGAISNAEMSLFMAASPGLQTTPQGNEALFNMIDAIADRQILRAQEMESWRQQNGTLDGFEAAWGDYINNNPIITEDMFNLQGGADDDVDALIDQYGNM